MKIKWQAKYYRKDRYIKHNFNEHECYIDEIPVCRFGDYYDVKKITLRFYSEHFKNFIIPLINNEIIFASIAEAKNYIEKNAIPKYLKLSTLI